MQRTCEIVLEQLESDGGKTLEVKATEGVVTEGNAEVK